MQEQLVLVGNGMAGVRTLEELLKIAPDKYAITVFGAECYGNYNRILLSPVLAGEKNVDDIMLNDEQWYVDNKITLHKGKTITHIDRRKRIVVADDGTTAHYDRLLLATGSDPFILPIPGSHLPGVISFRDLHDVEIMLETSRNYKHAVVIGGGLLGLEAANGLRKQGMSVTVVHIHGHLMERQLDYAAASLLKKAMEQDGIRFFLEKNTAAILGQERVTGIQFKDDQRIDADLVVMAAGIRPNIRLAKSVGLQCDKGVLVNDTMQTFDPRIYAVGECVQHRGSTYGLVAPLFEQAKVCANHLAAYGIARYEGSVTSTKLKVTGIEVFSAGNFHSTDKDDEIVFTDGARGIYKKIVLRNNKIQGAVLYGDTMDGAWYFQLMREKADVAHMRDNILFGQAHLGDAGHGDEKQHVNALPANAEICGCNGVCKGTIVDAIINKKLFTLDEVRAHTKASSSCGSCTGLVESLLAATVGGDYSANPKKKPLCHCTDYAHDEVRTLIDKRGLKSMDTAMRSMDWKTPDGCHVCRPALNFYLLARWPAEYQDDAQSRLVNERMHANIQKDGTYSVVPRIWGGVTNPAELRAIADVAEKYQIPSVKITGGQRIDLLGVTKEQLPAVWADLTEAGFVSGHAYGKSLRTVKTCVGSEWCRYGTQDSTGMGVKLEKLTWGSWTPHKFKMAVSGCPRNCAEATIKDFGVVAVDSGWELHVGGNGGVKVRATDFLCKVNSEAEVMEYAAAFMQLYREDARYLERTAPWIERVGLAYVKQHIVENEIRRKQLYESFKDSQRAAQHDPWARLSAGNHAEGFKTLTMSNQEEVA
ncbi:MAG: nitrite reductase large subunit NirB [Pseudomonadota bacterium]